LAAGAEATNIAAELDRLARRQLLPYARPDERIDPIDTTGFRKRAASGYRDIAGTPSVSVVVRSAETSMSWCHQRAPARRSKAVEPGEPCLP